LTLTLHVLKGWGTGLPFSSGSTTVALPGIGTEPSCLRNDNGLAFQRLQLVA